MYVKTGLLNYGICDKIPTFYSNHLHHLPTELRIEQRHRHQKFKRTNAKALQSPYSINMEVYNT